MDLVPDHIHRALMYVAALNDRGLAPTPNELDLFATTPVPESALRAGIFGRSHAILAKEDVVERAQPVVAYCENLGWFDATGGRITLTTTGYAVLLASAQEVELENSAALQTVVLEPNGPWLNYELTKVLASAGTGMIVDPFLKAESLKWIIENTKMNRALVEKQDNDELAYVVSSLLADSKRQQGARAIEVRIAPPKTLHDRAIVHASGQVTALGNSLNGIGKKLSIMVTLTPLIAKSYTSSLEEIWKISVVLPPNGPFSK